MIGKEVYISIVHAQNTNVIDTRFRNIQRRAKWGTMQRDTNDDDANGARA